VIELWSVRLIDGVSSHKTSHFT